MVLAKYGAWPSCAKKTAWRGKSSLHDRMQATDKRIGILLPGFAFATRTNGYPGFR
jgi:hypothetical protein